MSSTNTQENVCKFDFNLEVKIVSKFNPNNATVYLNMDQVNRLAFSEFINAMLVELHCLTYISEEKADSGAASSKIHNEIIELVEDNPIEAAAFITYIVKEIPANVMWNYEWAKLAAKWILPEYTEQFNKIMNIVVEEHFIVTQCDHEFQGVYFVRDPKRSNNSHYSHVDGYAYIAAEFPKQKKFFQPKCMPGPYRTDSASIDIQRLIDVINLYFTHSTCYSHDKFKTRDDLMSFIGARKYLHDNDILKQLLLVDECFNLIAYIQ